MKPRARVVLSSALLLGLSVAVSGCVTTSSPPAPPPESECPQPKFTGRAPDEIYSRKNPTAAVDLKLGEQLYFDEEPGRYSCATCHGRRGNGKGPMSSHFTPRPRNLACLRIANIPDGQVYWTIKNGSPGTDMPAHKKFNDEQIWQIVAYVKSL
jgi:cytochrome c peroxidase